MKNKKKASKVQSISTILEIREPDESGFLGFIIHYADGSFRNVLRQFTTQSYEQVLAELKAERDTFLQH
jgi:hypothetical protein